MSVQKRTWKDKSGKSRTAWRVRWQDGDTWRSETFHTKSDATAYDDEVRRRRRLGTVAQIDAGAQTLDQFVRDTFVPTYAGQLAPRTQELYASLYDNHITGELGSVELRKINPERIRRWQATSLRAGTGAPTVHKAHTLLGNILQRAVEGEHIQANPARAVKHNKVPKSVETIPLAPATIEAIRMALQHPASVEVESSAAGRRERSAYVASPPGTPYGHHQDATLVSVLAYAGLRPQEALALKWGDIGAKTLRVYSPKTNSTRSVRLLAPLSADLREFRMMSGRPADSELIFTQTDGRAWAATDYQNWRRRSFRRALTAAGIAHARPYDLRHSFASLLLHEGRSVIYVARQLGHDARLTLTTYGHVIDEFEDQPHLNAEAAIQMARSNLAAHQLPITGS